MTKPLSSTICIALVLPFGVCSAVGAGTAGTVPPGAVTLGYTKCVIREHPTAKDIAPGKNGSFKWFSGQWYQRHPPAADRYQDVGGVLALNLGGDLVSAPRDFSSPGLLPALPGADGFYVEVDVRLSDQDPDHWPAVWMMPVEHNNKQRDHYKGDPAKFERWMELDVDEGGFGPGLTGTVHSWTGIWPHYQQIQNKNNVVHTPLDRTRPHTFGASYDPKTSTVTWWLDGKEQVRATTPYVPDVAKKQHFYLIISAQSHSRRKHPEDAKDYRMFVSAVRAYVPPTSPLPALPLAVNILRNSSFQHCSNPGIPDWWSNSRGSSTLPDWPKCWAPDEQTAIPGVRSMRLHNPDARGGMFIQSYGYPATPGKAYSWSIYLKTDTPGGEANLSCGGLVHTKLKPGTDWQRFSGTAVCKKTSSRVRFWFTLSWGAKGNLWVCAPQLQRSDHPTAYAPSPLDNGQPGAKRTAPVHPQAPIPETPCPVLTATPALDGQLTEPAWKSAAKLSNFILYDADKPASQQTHVLVGRDATNLYLGIHCLDDKAGTLVNKVQGDHDAPVFGDDDIEVFLSPYPDGKDYRQFAINPAGARFEGREFAPSWDAPWQSAVRKDADGWTAELAIPFADLTYGPSIGDVWRLNICRHRAQEPEEYSTWSRVFGRFHQPDRFGKLTGMSGPDVQEWEVGFVDFKEDKGKLSVGVWSAVKRTGKVEVVDANSKVARTSACQADPDTPTLQLEARAGLPGSAVNLRFLSAAGKPVTKSTFAVSASAVPVEPLQAWLNRSFYTDGAKVTVVAHVNRPKARVIVTLPESDKPAASGIADALGWVTLPVPLRGGPGRHALHISLLGDKDATVSGKQLTAVILPPAPAMVPWDPASGSLLVNGRPVLPVAMGAHASLDTVRNIASAGFNAADLIFRYTMSDEEVKAILDECNRLGLGVIFWDHTKGLKYPEAKAKIVHWCEVFKSHPAILAWKVVDEPEGWWEKDVGKEKDLQDLHDAVSAADPYHPNFINHWAWKVDYGAYGGLKATDIYSVDRYPIGRQPFNDAMNNLASLFDRMDTDARHDGKPVHFWLQMYGSYDSPREPTPAEEACQTWLALVHGVRLISYFIYKPMSVDLWKSMRGLTKEVSALAPVLGTPQLPGLVQSSNPAIHCAAFRHNGKVVFVTVNPTDAPVKAQLALTALRAGKVRVLYEHRSVRTDGKSLADRWDAMARHVYELPDECR